MISIIADLQEEWYEARREHCATRPKRSPLQWAKEERWLGQGVSPLSQNGPIRYDPDAMPWCKEPMEAAVDPTVKEVVLWWASGMGKTEVVVNVLGHAICEEPANAFVVYPKEDSRDKFSQDVIDRAIDATPAMKSRVVEKKSRDVGNTVSRKKYPGGSLYMTSAGSASNFRGPRAKIIFCDEVDGYPDDVDGEGDPIALAYKRAEGFPNSIKIISGTGTWGPLENPDGTPLYRSRIHQRYEATDQRKWFFACKECAHEQFTRFEQIKAKPDDTEHAEYECENAECLARHTNDDLQTRLRAGRWIPTAPEKGRRGYWINGFSTTLPAEKGFVTKLHQFVEDAREAAKDPNTKRVWINTTCAGLDNPEGIGEQPPEWEPLKKRALPSFDDEKNGRFIVPNDALILCGGGDVHPDRIEWTWFGYGRGETCWVLDHKVFFGEVRDHTDHGPWHRLHLELQQSFVHERGGKIGLEMGLIDASYGWDDVDKFLRTGAMRGKLRACRGSTTYMASVVASYDKLITGKHGQCTLFGHTVGTDVVKDTLYSRLRMIATPEGFPDGWIHFYDRLSGAKKEDDSYFKQLTAEHVEIRLIGGREERRYQKKHLKDRNETTDTWVYGYAAMRRNSRWDWTAIEHERMKASAAEEEPESEPEREIRSAGRSGFGSGWQV